MDAMIDGERKSSLPSNPFNCHRVKAKVPIIVAAQTHLRNDSYFVAVARTSFGPERSKKAGRNRIQLQKRTPWERRQPDPLTANKSINDDDLMAK